MEALPSKCRSFPYEAICGQRRPTALPLFLDRFDFPAGIALNLAKAGRLQVVIDVPVGNESSLFLVPKYVQSEHRVKRVIKVDLRSVSASELDRNSCLAARALAASIRSGVKSYPVHATSGPP